jgi:hypothetical protein
MFINARKWSLLGEINGEEGQAELQPKDTDDIDHFQSLDMIMTRFQY